MQKSSKEFPWANIWMILFAAAGLWLLWPRSGFGTYLTVWETWPLFAILIIGFLRIPAGLYYESGDAKGTTLNDMARIYLSGFVQVFRRRWMLWLLGAVMAFVILGTAVGLATEPASPGNDAIRSTAMDRPSAVVITARVIHAAISSSSDPFLPSFNVTRTAMHTAAFALGLVAWMIYLSVYSRRLTDDPQESGRAGFFRNAVAPIVMVLGAVVIATPIAWFRFLAAIQQWRAGAAEMPSQWMLTVTLGFSGAFVALLLDALLAGAVLGSLTRARHGETVTSDTLTRDVIHYFRPMAGFFLLTAVVGLILFGIMSVAGNDNQGLMRFAWSAGVAFQWLSVLLMFVPAAIAVRDTGTFQGIKTGVRDWFGHYGDALSFVALGITLVSIPGALKRVPEQIMRWHSQPEGLGWKVFGYSSSIIYTAITLIVTAAVMIAVWEFYVSMTGSRVPDAAVRGGIDRGEP